MFRHLSFFKVDFNLEKNQNHWKPNQGNKGGGRRLTCYISGRISAIRKIIEQTILAALTKHHTPNYTSHTLTSWINNMVIPLLWDFTYPLSSNQASPQSSKCVESVNFSSVQPTKFINCSPALRSVSVGFRTTVLSHGCNQHVPSACSLTVWNLTCY